MNNISGAYIAKRDKMTVLSIFKPDGAFDSYLVVTKGRYLYLGITKYTIDGESITFFKEVVSVSINDIKDKVDVEPGILLPDRIIWHQKGGDLIFFPILSSGIDLEKIPHIDKLGLIENDDLVNILDRIIGDK